MVSPVTRPRRRPPFFPQVRNPWIRAFSSWKFLRNGYMLPHGARTLQRGDAPLASGKPPPLAPGQVRAPGRPGEAAEGWGFAVCRCWQQAWWEWRGRSVVHWPTWALHRSKSHSRAPLPGPGPLPLPPGSHAGQAGRGGALRGGGVGRVLRGPADAGPHVHGAAALLPGPRGAALHARE